MTGSNARAFAAVIATMHDVATVLRNVCGVIIGSVLVLADRLPGRRPRGEAAT
jgi:hypothetical protein